VIVGSVFVPGMLDADKRAAVFDGDTFSLCDVAPLDEHISSEWLGVAPSKSGFVTVGFEQVLDEQPTCSDDIMRQGGLPIKRRNPSHPVESVVGSPVVDVVVSVPSVSETSVVVPPVVVPSVPSVVPGPSVVPVVVAESLVPTSLPPQPMQSAPARMPVRMKVSRMCPDTTWSTLLGPLVGNNAKLLGLRDLIVGNSLAVNAPAS